MKEFKGPKIVPVVLKPNLGTSTNTKTSKHEIKSLENTFQLTEQRKEIQLKDILNPPSPEPLFGINQKNSIDIEIPKRELKQLEETKKRKYEATMGDKGLLQKYNRLIRCKKNHTHFNLIENGKRHFFCQDCKTPKTVVEYACNFCVEKSQKIEWKSIKDVQIHQTYECPYFPKKKAKKDL